MEFQSIITDHDVQQVRHIITASENNSFVRSRMSCNVSNEPIPVTLNNFWKMMIDCLLTTQQRSGPSSAIHRFMNQDPFPLTYELCQRSQNVEHFVKSTVQAYGGIRRYNSIAKSARINFQRLENNGWRQIESIISNLYTRTSKQTEREIARNLKQLLHGFGPKQTRNLLQGFGLTQYEIPLDSRITRWLQNIMPSIPLVNSALANELYYCFVLDIVQELCERAGVLPCIFDASVFASYDRDEWN